MQVRLPIDQVDWFIAKFSRSGNVAHQANTVDSCCERCSAVQSIDDWVPAEWRHNQHRGRFVDDSDVTQSIFVRLEVVKLR